ncbi:unnamed protein product [Soboliphyme baturini]|uniref:Mediator of RNA polymerase II transcription subunit 23 n=1 Tax=Soboliphyme baturini TaxID=241478 RepID=A0A183J2V2_9BILA|nr:unnamed protein product [Soboliphyme baturini]
MLLNVDKNCTVLQYEDTIVDLCYHMKYMYVGDSIRSETDRIITQLRPSLQLKLRYISNINIDHGSGGTSSVTSSTG